MVKPLQVFKGFTTFNVAGHPLHDFYRLDCLSECEIKDLKFYIGVLKIELEISQPWPQP